MIGRTLVHYLGVLTGVANPETQTTPAERSLLLANLPGMRTIVEVGVFEGFTTKLLSDHSDSDAVVYGVDPFLAGRLGIAWGMKIATRHNRKHLSSRKLRLIRAFSTEVGTSVPSPVDFVFIDADHSLEGIAADWAFWGDRVRSGGIIALHDTIPFVRKGRTELLGSHAYFASHIFHDPRFIQLAAVDSLSVMQKRPSP